MKTTKPIGQSGRVVIPSHMREQLGIEYGDLVEIDIRPIEEDGDDG